MIATGIWSQSLNASTNITFRPARDIAITHCCFGEIINEKHGRTVVKLGFEPKPDAAMEHAILCVVSPSNENVPLNIVLCEGENYNLHAKGKNTVYLMGNYIDNSDEDFNKSEESDMEIDVDERDDMVAEERSGDISYSISQRTASAAQSRGSKPSNNMEPSEVIRKGTKIAVQIRVKDINEKKSDSFKFTMTIGEKVLGESVDSALIGLAANEKKNIKIKDSNSGVERLLGSADYSYPLNLAIKVEKFM